MHEAFTHLTGRILAPLGPDPFTRGNTGPDHKRLSLSRSGYIAGLYTLLCIEGYKVSRKTCLGGMGSIAGDKRKLRE